MSARQQKLIVVCVIPALALGGIALDVCAPPSASGWVWYFLPLLLAMFVRNRFLPFILAGIFSVLTLAGPFLAKPVFGPGPALAGRGIGAGLLWLTAALIFLQQRMNAGRRRTERALRAIATCNEALNRTATEAELLQEVCRMIVEVGGYRLAWIGRVEHDAEKTVRPIAQAGLEKGYLEEMEVTWAETEWGYSPAGTAVQTKEPVIRRKLLNDPGCAPLYTGAIQCGYNSMMVLPLVDEGRVFNVLTLCAAAPDAFDTGEVNMLTKLADDLACGILALRTRLEHQRMAEHVQEQARMLDRASDAIIVRDLEDRVQYWNKSAERIYGWTAEEAAGRAVQDLLHKHVFSVSRYQQAGKGALEKGYWQGEFATQSKDGQEVVVESRWTLVRDPQGNPKSVLIISTDISAKKKLEVQLLRVQRMEGLCTLAGGIAHDFNNILAPLLVSIQMLKGKLSKADQQKLLTALEANIQRGAGLVKQVLAFGRGMEGERILVQTKHIARDIQQVVQETFPKSVTFELRTAADLWTLVGDPTQLHQVLLNLCLNARDAMLNGGKLSIYMENLTFDETYAGMNPEAKAGPYVLIEVSDTGTGIPKEIQERIYDPFFTTKEKGKATGLGLSTTLAIVKSHGGFIHCHSTAGQGTSFRVYLPASLTPAVAEKAAVDPAKLPRGHNELVLIVDDEVPILKVARKTLERFGYRVLPAMDGAEAVNLFKSRQQDIAVVITDVAMPNLDGPATISALRKIKPDVKIIGSSGLSSDGGRSRVKAAGIEHFLAKPYTAESVLLALRDVLQQKPTG
jgi:two-component system cell cycle sensor histidine kinase/response regulator CckA